MLQSIRDRATGVFAWVIVILLIIPFALWGIQEYLGGGGAINVAVVGDTKISRNELNTKVDRALKGRKDKPEGAALLAFRKNILNQLIQEEVLHQSAIDRGFRIHESIVADKIQNNEVFHVDGKFSSKYYQDLLRSNGLNTSYYERLISRELLIQQFVESVMASSFVTKGSVDRLIDLQDRKLDLAYAEYPLKNYLDAVKVSDEEVKEYYSTHKQNFMTQSQVKISYLLLDAAELATQIEVTEKQLQDYYADYKDSFLTPEQKRVAHIQFELADAQKADEVYAKLQKGAKFADMAKQFSVDAGSATKGGEIGVLEAGSLDKAFEDALAKLAKDEYSKPVKTEFGYHIIKLLELKPGTSKSFAEAKVDVEKLYRKKQADDLFLDRKDQFYNKTYENPDSLEVAAVEFGMKIKTSDWFTRAGSKTDDVIKDSKVVAEAFSGDVFADGDASRSLNSKLIELKGKDGHASGRVVVIRLADYKPSQEQTLEQIKPEILKTIKHKQASIKLEEDLQAGLKLAQEGTALEQLAKDKSFQYKAAGFVGRIDKKHDALMLQAAFKAAKPEKDKPTFITAHTLNGDGVLVAIKAMQTGLEQKDNPSRSFMAQFMQRFASNEELTAFVEQLKSEAEITIFNDRIDQDDS